MNINVEIKDDEVYKKFKTLCVKEDKTIITKINEMVKKEIEEVE